MLQYQFRHRFCWILYVLSFGVCDSIYVVRVVDFVCIYWFLWFIIIMKLKAPSLYPKKPDSYYSIVCLFIFHLVENYHCPFFILLSSRAQIICCFSYQKLALRIILFLFNNIFVKCSSYPWTFEHFKPYSSIIENRGFKYVLPHIRKMLQPKTQEDQTNMKF